VSFLTPIALPRIILDNPQQFCTRHNKFVDYGRFEMEEETTGTETAPVITARVRDQALLIHARTIEFLVSELTKVHFEDKRESMERVLMEMLRAPYPEEEEGAEDPAAIEARGHAKVLRIIAKGDALAQETEEQGKAEALRIEARGRADALQLEARAKAHPAAQTVSAFFEGARRLAGSIVWGACFLIIATAIALAIAQPFR
jgi:hypothetical protein